LTVGIGDPYAFPVLLNSVRALQVVNVTHLRQHLRACLERARSGERILITSRGVVIAELAPPTLSADAVSEIRARLEGSLVAFDRPFDPVLAPGERDVER